MKKQPIIPQFKPYVCPGDTVSWQCKGFDLTALVEFDRDAHVNNYDNYSKKQISAWKNDEWFFCRIVISVSLNGVELTNDAESLSSIECNFPSRRKNPNTHLSEVCADLENSAIANARAEQSRILAALGATP